MDSSDEDEGSRGHLIVILESPVNPLTGVSILYNYALKFDG